MLPNYSPLHPKQYREKSGLTRQQIAVKTRVPFNTLKNWLADETSESYREPTEITKLYFGLIDALENSDTQ